MERWEPPVTTTRDPDREQRPDVPRPDRRGIWADAVAASGGRLAVAALLAVPSMMAVPSPALIALALAALGGLFIVTVRAWRRGRPSWSLIWCGDVVSLGCLTPVAVMNGFVASEPRPLLAAERAAYAETAALAFLSFAALSVIAWWSEDRLPGMGGMLLLPGALLIPALVAAFDDYRNATVLLAVAGAYAVAGGATLAAWFMPVAGRMWSAAGAWLVFMGGLTLLTPGLSPLGQRLAPVNLYQPALIVWSLALLIVVPLVPRVQGQPVAGTPRRKRVRWRGGRG